MIVFQGTKGLQKSSYFSVMQYFGFMVLTQSVIQLLLSSQIWFKRSLNLCKGRQFRLRPNEMRSLILFTFIASFILSTSEAGLAPFHPPGFLPESFKVMGYYCRVYSCVQSLQNECLGQKSRVTLIFKSKARNFTGAGQILTRKAEIMIFNFITNKFVRTSVKVTSSKP